MPKSSNDNIQRAVRNL